MKLDWNFIFGLPLVFSKFYVLCTNQKKLFCGRKWHCRVTYIPWYGISSENLEKVEFGAKWNALMVRSAGPGQVRSCKVIWNWKYIYNIQCAIQKPPTKFHVNGAIEPRVIAVDTRIASGHLTFFAIYLHIKTGISKSFKVPAILFGTLNNDVLPMICAKYCWFLRRQKYLKIHFFNFDLESSKVIQKSWHFHGLCINGWTLNISLVVDLVV